MTTECKGLLTQIKTWKYFFLEDFSSPKENSFLSDIEIKLQLARSCTGTPNFQADIIRKEEGSRSLDKITRRTLRKT